MFKFLFLLLVFTLMHSSFAEAGFIPSRKVEISSDLKTMNVTVTYGSGCTYVGRVNSSIGNYCTDKINENSSGADNYQLDLYTGRFKNGEIIGKASYAGTYSGRVTNFSRLNRIDTLFDSITSKNAGQTLTVPVPDGWVYGERICMFFAVKGYSMWGDGAIPNNSNICGRGSVEPIVPPELITCTASNNVDIDFETIDIAEVKGKSKEVTLGINCSDAAAYSVKLASNSSSIPLSNGMKAAMTIDGDPFGKKQYYSQREGMYMHTIKTVLEGSPVTGFFSGSDTIIVSIP